MMARKLIASLCLFGALAGCGELGDRPTNGTANQLAEVSGDRSSRRWVTKSYSDDMDDVRTHEALAQFASGNFTLQVLIKCREGEGLSYQFSNFKGEEGIALSSPTSFGGRRIAKVRARLDGGSAENWTVDVTDYSNAFTVKDEDDRGERWLKVVTIVNEDVASGRPKGYSLFASRMGQARTITLRVGLLNGVASYKIDQSDAAVRSVLSQCPAREPFEPEPTVSPAPSEVPAEDDQAEADEQSVDNVNEGAY